MPLPVTIRDRFAAAWKAFRQNHKPDPDAFKKFVQSKREDNLASVMKLGAADVALVHMIAEGAKDSDRLLEELLPKVKELPIKDRLNIVKHISNECPEANLLEPMRRFCAGREITRAAVEDTKMQRTLYAEA